MTSVEREVECPNSGLLESGVFALNPVNITNGIAEYFVLHSSALVGKGSDQK